MLIVRRGCVIGSGRRVEAAGHQCENARRAVRTVDAGQHRHRFADQDGGDGAVRNRGRARLFERRADGRAGLQEARRQAARVEPVGNVLHGVRQQMRAHLNSVLWM